MRKQILIVTTFLIGLVSLPSNNSLSGTTVMNSLDIGTRKRTYQVYLPTSYTQKANFPLLIALHGRLGDGKGMAKLTSFDRIAEQNKFIVVYPDGYQRSWADGRGSTPADRENVDDVAFISGLIDHLGQEFAIDRQRVYAVGISNGGFMAQRLGCQLPQKIAAIATVSATSTEAVTSTCQHPLPILLMHGTEDPLTPYNGKGNMLSVTTSVAKWLAINHCVAQPQIVKWRDRFQDGTTVTQETYAGRDCPQPVVLYKIDGGGHSWAGGRQYLPVRVVGTTSQEINASKVIWEFFQRQSLS